MKYFVVVCKHLPADGMAIYPFLLVKKPQFKKNFKLLRHECIHFQQQLELLIIPFYILYACYFIYYWLRFKNRNKAYLAIPFEREAYHYEGQKGYLQKRKYGAWFKFHTTNIKEIQNN